MRSPGSELEGAGLLVEGPVSEVELAEGLEVRGRHPEDVAAAFDQKVNVAEWVDARFFGAKIIFKESFFLFLHFLGLIATGFFW